MDRTLSRERTRSGFAVSAFQAEQQVSRLASESGNTVGEHACGEEALAPVQPDPFDRVELGAVGRPPHQRHGVGHAQIPGDVPARPVQHHDGLRVRLQRLRKLRQEQAHRLSRDPRQHQAERRAGLRLDGGEDAIPPRLGFDWWMVFNGWASARKRTFCLRP